MSIKSFTSSCIYFSPPFWEYIRHCLYFNRKVSIDRHAHMRWEESVKSETFTWAQLDWNSLHSIYKSRQLFIWYQLPVFFFFLSSRVENAISIFVSEINLNCWHCENPIMPFCSFSSHCCFFILLRDEFVVKVISRKILLFWFNWNLLGGLEYFYLQIYRHSLNLFRTLRNFTMILMRRSISFSKKIHDGRVYIVESFLLRI